MHQTRMRAKIAFLLPNYYGQSVGGTEYRVYLLALYLLSRGHAVYYIFVDNGHPYECTPGLSLFPMKSKWWPRRLGKNTLIYRKSTHAALCQIRPDIVYQTHACGLTGIAARYCRTHMCKMVWHIASRKDVNRLRLRQWYLSPCNWVEKKYLEYGIHNAAAIIGQAQYQNALLQENYGRTCDMVVPNYQPVPTEVIAKTPSPLNVIWIGNIKSIKQPELFIQLAQRLSRHPGVKFIMVGRPASGRYQERLDRMLSCLQNIEYRRELPMAEVNTLLARSHILVNTSRYEGFSNTFVQAWMRSVPVISLHEDPDEMITKHRLGFHSHTFEQLVSDTDRLLSDSLLRNAMAEASRAFAYGQCSLETNCAKIENLLLSLLS